MLWEKDCAFCVSNAASNEVTCIPISYRKGLAAFNKLFEEIDGKPTRAELGISVYCPTNPQAEILVFDCIEPKYIIGAITQNKATETELKTKQKTSIPIFAFSGLPSIPTISDNNSDGRSIVLISLFL